MYRNGYYVDKSEVEAFRIYMHCAQGLNEDTIHLVGADIMIRLGDCFFKGIGTEVDNKQALKYYQLAEQMYYERLESGDFLIKNCYKFVAFIPHACVWDESHISLDIYLEKNI